MNARQTRTKRWGEGFTDQTRGGGEIGEQGSRSGDCPHLPPMWPGFDFGLVAVSGLSWLLVLYSAPRGFSPGSLVFPSAQKSTFPNSNSIGCRTSLKTTFE